MASNTISTHLTKAQIQERILAASSALSGRGAQDSTVHDLKVAVGMAALAFVKEAFVAKSRGGTDAAGESWQPLSPKYIAYGRRHPGLTAKRATAKAQGRPGRPLLTKKQDQRWRQVYARKLHQLAGRNTPTADHKGQAAAAAWLVLKAEGGKTIYDTYKDTSVQILVDTGVLLNSLSPGLSGKPSGHPNQIVREDPGAILVGTNRKGAAAQHRKRPLWPDPSRWPQTWWDQLLRVQRDGLLFLLGQRLQ